MRATIAVLLSTLFAAPLVAQDTIPSPPKPYTPEEEAKYLALGSKYITWFLQGHADSLLSVMSAEMGEGGVDVIRRQMDVVAERGGTLIKVVEQKMTRRRGLIQYWWAGSFSEMPNEDIVIRYILDENGKIIGAGLGPRAGAPAPDTE